VGLLAELPRKNCQSIAEHAGDRAPDGMQHLLSRLGVGHDHLSAECRQVIWDLGSGPNFVKVLAAFSCVR
jgi:hypothetical protein